MGVTRVVVGVEFRSRGGEEGSKGYFGVIDSNEGWGDQFIWVLFRGGIGVGTYHLQRDILSLLPHDGTLLLFAFHTLSPLVALPLARALTPVTLAHELREKVRDRKGFRTDLRLHDLSHPYQQLAPGCKKILFLTWGEKLTALLEPAPWRQRIRSLEPGPLMLDIFYYSEFWLSGERGIGWADLKSRLRQVRGDPQT